MAIWRIVMSNNRELFLDAPQSGIAYDHALQAYPGETVTHISAVGNVGLPAMPTVETDETDDEGDN